MGEFNQREYQTVLLGALLHDVGKMLQRGSFGELDTTGKHPLVSSHFVSAFNSFFSRITTFQLLQNIVQRHHEDPRLGEDMICQNAPDEYKALCYLVSRADNYSSSERGKNAEDYRKFKSVPLVSIFSRINIGKTMPEKLKYHPKPLNSEDTFPEKFEDYKPEELNDHLKSFGEEFKLLLRNNEKEYGEIDFEKVFVNIHTILMRYSWCIPSNTQEEIPDVSLFDHLKTTCAIAACLYQYHHTSLKIKEIKNDKQKKFILLAGDLSGIQNYIFNISHIGSGGVAKRLRARSFQLVMLSEIVSHKILHAVNLPITNLLMSSGGKFYILLPNIPKAIDSINEIMKHTDLMFHKYFNAEINLNIEMTGLSGDDFGNYSGVLSKLNRSLQVKKKEPFKNILTTGELWNNDMATLNVDFGDEEKLCKACSKFPGIIDSKIDDDTYICDKCRDDKEIGQKLPAMKYIVFYNDNTGRFNNNYFSYSFDLLKDLNDYHRVKKAYLILSVGEYKPDSGLPIAHRFIANHVSYFSGNDDCDACRKTACTEKSHAQERQPRFFECIANESTGKPLLGYLKADVDNLGGVFACGLKDGHGEDAGTVSRVTTLSRMLDVFFSGYMQKLIETEYPELYTVYSGGDDLLVIGPWDSIVKFSDELNTKFRNFTCNNDNLTLSAGIALVKHNYPVYRAVEMAENLLEISKDSGKDSLTLFEHTVKWAEVGNILQESQKLASWLKQNKISTGFVMNLLSYSQMYDKYQQTRQTDYLKFIPLMTYDIARNLLRSEDDVRKWAEDLKDITKPNMKNLGIIANYALTANRGGKDG
ncbi:type III-A CRISPR-associated protein Cas10/Csm1 [Candidatus Magnetominusculus xianensis]|uniref:CRISPR system single-strand-specific deoxyribonuclease Cas10/Csm1 (subtype III-A) n=1 Tax=Candidatus Magnetominusculus xianensis TaxID=1748249 RepID=A0ABR5SJS1_9BACT|nr:type III-A CRISPR-associated protein Cas10/Csm1 [Candidatus Magnetominusculus xianensis]KWT94954.1 CRISPR-associated protein Csm1 [Candidatus Magnetominusculus xianensis]MBF0405200.1 type III-A CRISPR-associated protein Cas10/Csm1 [Nitrospirota bacterium]